MQKENNYSAEEKISDTEAEAAAVSESASPDEVQYLSDSVKMLTPMQMVVKRFFRSKLSIVGLCIIIFLFLFSFVGPVFAKWGETEPDMTGGKIQKNPVIFTYTDPEGVSCDAYLVNIDKMQVNRYDTTISSSHFLGTDDQGMDVFARLMYGGQVSLTLSFIVVILETVLGVILGGLAGYFGKWVDMLVMRAVDILNCIPTLPIMLIVSVIFDSYDIMGRTKLYYIMIFLTLLGWTGVARVVRGQILALREQEFMVAAEACGIPASKRIFKHLVPNVMPQLIVAMTLGLGSIILTEATLGYLGLGLDYPSASWGTIINSTSDITNIESYWNMWIPAGVCIVLAVLGFNFIGDGLRDALDPRMKR